MQRHELTALASYLYQTDQDRELWQELCDVLESNGSHPKNEIKNGLTPELKERIADLKKIIKNDKKW